MAERKQPGATSDDRTIFKPYSAFEIPADLRELHGRYDVESMARRVRNFRYAEEWTMMMLGGWLATVPELPVKTGLGKVIWETAQAADLLGARLPELRCGRKGATQAEAANQGFADFVQAIAEPEDASLTIEKLVGVFEVLKPHLIDVYERTAESTDEISDAPTIEILEQIVGKSRRHVAWGREVLDALSNDVASGSSRRQARRELLAEQLRACGGVVGKLPETTPASRH